MTFRNLELLQSFDEQSLPDLDTTVLGALELFQKETLPSIDVSVYKRPIVVGSGNAEATGRIIFRNHDAVFASESTYEEKLKHVSDIDGVVLISASGSKHAPIIAHKAQDLGKKVLLVTNTKDAPAAEHADDVQVFPKNREPYTYNTSTYMGMILGETKESSAAIQSFIHDTIDVLDVPDFSKHDKFYLIVPTQFAGIIRMLQVKFIELFGRRVARDVETTEYVKHATTIVPSDELFISFGEESTEWGEYRLHVPLPRDANYGAMMAIAYYVIGKIQKAYPPYFKDNIVSYTKEASTTFGHTITPIIE